MEVVAIGHCFHILIFRFLAWFGWCLKSFAGAGIVPHGEVVDLGGDFAGKCVVVLAEVGELGLPAVAPDAEACCVEFGVESCGTQGGEGGCFSFHFCRWLGVTNRNLRESNLILE